MNILIVNSYDTGGAANSCKRLHLGLRLIGINSNVLLRFKNNNWIHATCFKHPTKIISTSDKLKNKIKRILKELKIYSNQNVFENEEQIFIDRRSKDLEMFSFPNSNIDIKQSDEYRKCDIVNLHWVANFLDYQTFFVNNNKPIVWTLHDMNPFTGGEHYEEKYCGIDDLGFPIKKQTSEDEKRRIRENIEIKKMAISNSNNLTIVAPSQWLAKEARKSEVFKGLPVFCIPYGLDSTIFAPREKKYSRELLNIPNNKKILLFVADSIDNSRKGFVFLKKALEILNDSNLIVCAIGNDNNELDSINNVIKLGPIYDERLMSIAYSAADVFVIPSLMDNLPNTVLESLMCGTPVIGFPVGGIFDMIQDGQNGLIAKEISVQSLCETVQEFFKFDRVYDRDEIRNNALKKYDLKIQAFQYKKIFDSIIQKKN